MSTTTRRRRKPAARAARRVVRAPRRVSSRARRRLIALTIAVVVVLGLYASVIRDLPAFRIEALTLTGASSGYGPRLQAELEGAARGMTTLHVDHSRLSEISGRYPAVIDLVADPDFPHRLAVRIRERPPVGLVPGRRGRRVPVAADGSLLEGQPIDRPLPALPGRASSGRRARRESTTAAARLTAAAPPPLAASLKRVRQGGQGWSVELREGPELRFGSLTDLEAKWQAAAAVLRDRAARGARYVDVRLPDRPAAGGFPAPEPPAPNAGGDASSDPDSSGSPEAQPEVESSPQP